MKNTDETLLEMQQKPALLKIAEDFELFHNNEKKAYATISKDGHSETYLIRGAAFKDILQSKYYLATKKSISKQSMQEVLDALHAKAVYEGGKKQVFYRVAWVDNNIYVDLGNDDHSIVRITPEGWKLYKKRPVKFIRNNTMLPLPIPRRGGDINNIGKFINVPNQNDLRMVIAWILQCYRLNVSCPILVAQGEHGSGKSSLCRLVLSLIDPRSASLRTMPKKEQDLIVTALHNHVIAFDNLSGISIEMSDALCRVATGGGLSGRKLYSDDEEFVIDVKRPLLVNGIDNIARRADFASRSVILNLPVIHSKNRMDEASLNLEFEKQKPYLLGSIFDALAQ